MTNRRLVYNGLRTTLGVALTAGATAVTFSSALTHAGGTNVPTLAGGDYIPLAIVDPVSGALTEIVRLTAYTAGATTGTITRAQESTPAVAHGIGGVVVCAPLADDIQVGNWVAFPYAANWSDVAGFQAGRYRMLPRQKQFELEFSAVRATSSSGVDSTIGTLPVGFRPLASHVVGTMYAAGGTVPTVNRLYITSAGLVATQLSMTIGSVAHVSAIVPLD